MLSSLRMSGWLCGFESEAKMTRPFFNRSALRPHGLQASMLGIDVKAAFHAGQRLSLIL